MAHIHNAEILVTHRHAHVCLHMWVLLLTADQSVPLMQNVQVFMLVYNRNVKIHVLVHVVLMLNVMCFHMCLYVIAQKVILGIHLQIVIQNLKPPQNLPKVLIYAIHLHVELMQYVPMVCVHVYKNTKVILIKVVGQNVSSVVNVHSTWHVSTISAKILVLVLVDQVLTAVYIIIFRSAAVLLVIVEIRLFSVKLYLIQLKNILVLPRHVGQTVSVGSIIDKQYVHV